MAACGGTTHHHAMPVLTCQTQVGYRFPTTEWITTIAADQARQDKAQTEGWVALVGGQPTSNDGSDLSSLAAYLAPGAHRNPWGSYHVAGGTTLVHDAKAFSSDAQNLLSTAASMGGWAPQNIPQYRAIQSDIHALSADCPPR